MRKREESGSDSVLGSKKQIPISNSYQFILDDRGERLGVKFKDSELVGFPLRVGIGEKSLAKGEVELKPRAGALVAVKAEEVVAKVKDLLPTL